MKKKSLLFVAAICAISITSCKKESETPTTPTVTPTPAPTPTPTVTPTPTPVTGFKWVVNTTDTVTADSAYYAATYKTIKAFKGGTAKFIEINLTAGTPATYTVGGGNAISYLVGSALYTAASGSVIITTNASSKMTGSFTSSGTGGSVTSLSAVFTDIDVK